MSNEARFITDPGLTLYFHKYADPKSADAGKVWYPTWEVFETYGTGARDADDYDISLTEYGAGLYMGDFDANITTEGRYIYEVRQQLGANPADTDAVLGGGVIDWNGKSEYDPLVSHRAAYLRAALGKQNLSSGLITYYDTDDATALFTEAEAVAAGILTRTITML